MPRKEPEKRTHTRPEDAGEQNLVRVKMASDEQGIMDILMPMKEHGSYVRTTYKGLWTEELLEKTVNDFFVYCTEKSFKPTKPALRVWLGVSRDIYWEWETKQEKYGYKSDIIREANDIMESYLQSNIDKYPTGSCFLLRTSHGHVESSKVDVTTNGNSVNTSDELLEAIKKLGLDT